MGKTRFAFMGFQHGHIFALLRKVSGRDDVEVVAACEEDESTRKSLSENGEAEITHTDYRQMLDETDCDVVAVGDYYGKRGAVAIEALKRGKHVIADKPFCTRLSEFEEIERLVRDQGLVVGCMFTLRNSPKYLTLKRLVCEGEIGEIHAMSFEGQHPMHYDTRPKWYYDPDKHGGTINDIAIHAIDALPWITGLKFSKVNAARNWHGPSPYADFRDCAQVMLTMDNGSGVLGDVSYLQPDSFAFKLPSYWRTTLWGSDGVLEVDAATKGVMLFKNGEPQMRLVPFDPPGPTDYLGSFLREIRGETNDLNPSSAEVLESTRVVLIAQHAADRELTDVAL